MPRPTSDKEQHTFRLHEHLGTYLKDEAERRGLTLNAFVEIILRDAAYRLSTDPHIQFTIAPLDDLKRKKPANYLNDAT